MNTIINILAEFSLILEQGISPVIQNHFQNDVQTCENEVPKENLTFANAIIVISFLAPPPEFFKI